MRTPNEGLVLARRGFLQAGAVSLLGGGLLGGRVSDAAQGLTLPALLAADAVRRPSEPQPRARACILVFMEGGPAHQDLWDVKPLAPAEYRGDFRAIASSLPGSPVCEHLPHLARQMHRVALIRSVHHAIVDHNAGAYYALTGRPPLRGSSLIVSDRHDNFPPFGSIASLRSPSPSSLPPFVQLPDTMSNNGYDLPGQRAGFLGPAWDPLVAGDPSVPNYTLPGLALPAEMPPERLAARDRLLSQLHQAPSGGGPARWASFRQRAFDLLTSPATQQAFDLSQEPARVREWYGLPDRSDRSVEARKFGGLPHLGQCMLLARRLIEAGVRLVTVCCGRRLDQAWDTHRDHFPLLKQSLLPYFDRAFAALLEDLAQRELLADTLVVAMGEFGRTPRLGQITSSAGADQAGRDHWPHCYTVLLAGAGIAAGALFGASDRLAAYPARDPVTPEDIAATIYLQLGIDPQSQIIDPLGRPHSVALGHPIVPLFA